MSDSENDVDDVSSDEEYHGSRETFGQLLNGDVEKYILKSVRIKYVDPCIHCGYGGKYYKLIKIEDISYLVLKFFQCLSYDMEDESEIKWVGSSLIDLPHRYHFLLKNLNVTEDD